MDFVTNFLQTQSKAIAAGLVSALIALLARYGFKIDAQTTTALGVISTVVVSYLVTHILVYLSPANKSVK